MTGLNLITRICACGCGNRWRSLPESQCVYASAFCKESSKGRFKGPVPGGMAVQDGIRDPRAHPSDRYQYLVLGSKLEVVIGMSNKTISELARAGMIPTSRMRRSWRLYSVIQVRESLAKLSDEYLEDHPILRRLAYESREFLEERARRISQLESGGKAA